MNRNFRLTLTIIFAIVLGLFMASGLEGAVDTMFEALGIFVCGLCMGTVAIASVELFSRR